VRSLVAEVIRSSILLGKRYLPWRKASGLYGEGQRKQMQSKLLTVGGEKDVIFKDKTHLLSWEHYTTAAFEFLSIAEGSHLFLNEEAAMANFVPALSAVLASAASSSSSSS
jgi:surfactin synthase thioesterase subunit